MIYPPVILLVFGLVAVASWLWTRNKVKINKYDCLEHLMTVWREDTDIKAEMEKNQGNPRGWISGFDFHAALIDLKAEGLIEHQTNFPSESTFGSNKYRQEYRITKHGLQFREARRREKESSTAKAA